MEEHAQQLDRLEYKLNELGQMVAALLALISGWLVFRWLDEPLGWLAAVLGCITMFATVAYLLRRFGARDGAERKSPKSRA